MAPVVAIASEFLDAFAGIPRAQQRKVREFTEKFRTNPTSTAINYEKIHSARDKKVRTVRIGSDYRAVVLHPDAGNIFMLVWVDHHDEAMEWARNRVFEINPATGSLQVVNTQSLEQLPTAPKKAESLFDAITDVEMVSLGVPEILLPSVRAIAQADDLGTLLPHLPAEASEALTWLSEGFSIDEVRSVVAAPKEQQPVDTEDFAKALEHPDSKRRFVKVTSQHDLNAILNAPLEKWRVFLHPSQEKIVSRSFSGPAKVTGGAGTGKTVVAMHRARHLVRDVFTQSTDRVLITTYTKNLARDIEQNLQNLCGDEYKRLEVTHLHLWAVKFMKTQGFDFSIADEHELTQCWEQALSVAGETAWDITFLKDEWNVVVRGNGVEKKQDYLVTRRVGRGKTLTRSDRARVWSIFEEYTAALRDKGKVDWSDVIGQTRRFLENRDILPYKSVVVDEAQDFHEEEWRLIRALVPEGANDLFIVGDAHQRIYGRSVVLGKCGINIRGRSSKLRINYRTTQEIKKWAVNILHDLDIDDLDGGIDDQSGYTSLLSGPAPGVLKNRSRAEEQDVIAGTVQDLLKSNLPEDICVVARTSNLLKKYYGPALAKAGIPHTFLEGADNSEQQGVRLATMHRVKGLEFRCVIIAGVDEGTLPLLISGMTEDPDAKEQHDRRERSLLFVAATRARDFLAVTCSEHPSAYISSSVSSK
jgi:superfamily I DNA/RNA helicase